MLSEKTLEILAIVRTIIDTYKNRPILVYFDPDVDGLFSGKLVCDYLDMLGLRYQCYVNPDRAHGFKQNMAILRGYLVIAVDFAITSAEMTQLLANDIAIVSIDHHDTEIELIHQVTETCEGVVVNNQYPFEPDEDRYLSGAGVVYETICRLDQSFKSIEREALVGITLLSDARVIENAKARAYLEETYKSNPNTGYIRYLLSHTVDKDYGFGQPRMDRNFIDYSFSPRINSMLRFGYHNEAMNFIMGYGLEVENPRPKQKQVIDEMKKYMRVLDLQGCKVLVVRTEDLTHLDDLVQETVKLSCFIGLLCSDVKGNGKSVFAFILDNGSVSRASFRGQFDDVNYNSGFHTIGINAQGHNGAFGVVNFTFTADTWVQMDNIVSNLNIGHKSTVKVIKANNLSFVLNGKGKNVLNNVSSGMFSNQSNRGYDIALENCFVRDLNRTYIKYEGNLIIPTVKSAKFCEYLIDGRLVKCFDPNLSPKDGLILPLLEKGYVQLYLKEAIVD